MITGTIRGVKQPSVETWSQIARAHQGYHTQIFEKKGAQNALEAIDLLSHSPVSDHVLDAGWLAVEASSLQRRRSGTKYFDLADKAWRNAQTHSTDILDRLQAGHALAFLPLFRQVYLGKKPDLIRLDKRLTGLTQAVLEEEVCTDYTDYRSLLGASAEIAISALTIRSSVLRQVHSARAWPTTTRDDRARTQATNVDLNIGSYPLIEKQIQIKHGKIAYEKYEIQGTPTISITETFPEVVDEPLFVIKALATTAPEDALSIELCNRTSEAIAMAFSKVAA